MVNWAVCYTAYTCAFTQILSLFLVEFSKMTKHSNNHRHLKQSFYHYKSDNNNNSNNNSSNNNDNNNNNNSNNNNDEDVIISDDELVWEEPVQENVAAEEVA